MTDYATPTASKYADLFARLDQAEDTLDIEDLVNQARSRGGHYCATGLTLEERAELVRGADEGLAHFLLDAADRWRELEA